MAGEALNKHSESFTRLFKTSTEHALVISHLPCNTHVTAQSSLAQIVPCAAVIVGPQVAVDVIVRS